MDILKTENGIFNEDRFKNNRVGKVKRLKTGMIVAIIVGTLFIASQSLMLVNQNWYYAAKQRIYIDYNNGEIDYDTYYNKREQLELNFYDNLLTVSILSTIASVSTSITFIFIIICLLSIVLDESFNRKMRRLALGLAVITLFFVLYPMFLSPNIYIEI
ncbi:MAG: hypothetical protein ACFE94_14615 [Candidatus Hodarchaeota archaeon]